MASILIIDDDVTFCLMLKTLLEKNGYQVTTVFSPVEAKRMFQDAAYDVVLTDLRMPEISGMDLIHLGKNGAFNYIPKPLSPDEVLNVVREALADSENQSLVESPSKPLLPAEYQEGVSSQAKQMRKHIDLVAPTPMSVLIVGESGTGKEYVAKLIHARSKRARQPFVAVDCGAIPKELVASEFFGHVKGSFTGAIADKVGNFEAANGGTLFLDEVGNLPYNSQIQLLRVLQERLIKPVGSNKEITVDVRIIAATNENLLEAQQKGSFREDLYHRLNEFQINVPPLRERPQDILYFAQYFLEQSNRYLDKAVEGFEKSLEPVFQDYSWPGNLRELKNVVKRATLLAHGKWITLNEIPAEIYSSGKGGHFALHNEQGENELILKALKATNYNKSQAARLLKIDRKTLYNKLKIYKIELPGRDE